MLSIRKIAVIRQDNRIGNLIFTIPLLEALKEDFPLAELDVVTGYKFSEILERVKVINKIIPFDQKRAAINFFYYFSFRSKLKKTGYDLVIDAGSMTSLSTNNILIGTAARSKVYVGYDRQESAAFLDIAVPQINEKQHESQLLLHLADYISNKKRVLYPTFSATEEERKQAEKMLTKLGISTSDTLIGIHVGGRYDKRWDLDNFIKLAHDLGLEGKKVIMFSGPNEADLLKEMDLDSNLNVYHVQSAPIDLVIGLTARCNLFVTGDNGPLHIAAALGIPSVQIFKVDNYDRYGYTNLPHKIVTPLNPPYEKVLTIVRGWLNR
ncbi:lipopolysaccharide heptosyltransferase family protein [Candidatus Marinimicrobia bacterium MT.SAG.3]|nr:lipopolysaccharide heptosyltransferase family protein [Candidatus Marinimicrobia bacterium MT.SAG.3]